VPLGRRSDKGFVLGGQPEPPKDRGPLALTQWVTPDYHQTFGIGLLAGRYFTAADREDAAGVAIVDEEFVKKFLPRLEPRTAIGQRVRLLDDPAQWREIVGIVRHIRHSGLDEQPRVEVYVPFAQSEPGWQVDVGRAMDIGIRGTASADAIVSSVRQEFRAFDPEVLLSHVTTLEDALSRSMSSRRFNLVLLSLFGGAALLLCVVGIYGVVSYSVAQRTREIGVRLTLGAQPTEVLRLVMGRGLWLVAAGITAGAVTAFWLARVVDGLLYGVQPRDPVTFGGAIVILITVAAFASYVPARRAMNVDVVAALRAD
jgi:predicted permease